MPIVSKRIYHIESKVKPSVPFVTEGQNVFLFYMQQDFGPFCRSARICHLDLSILYLITSCEGTWRNLCICIIGSRR